MDSFGQQAKELVAAVNTNHTGFSEAEMEANARGPHWNCNMGYDRNIKKVRFGSTNCYFAYAHLQSPRQTAWHRKNKELSDRFFKRDSPAFTIK